MTLVPTTLSLKKGKSKFRLAGGPQPLILVPVTVNGQGPFDFIFDTGAGTSLLSRELAQRLDVKILGSKEGQSAGGKVAVSLAKVDSMAVGQTQVDAVDVGIVDLSHVSKTIGANLDGDLGYNFLKHFRIGLDYAKCEISFEDAKRFARADSPARSDVPLRLASPAKPLILAEVYANQRGPFQFAVDTGTSTTAITPELASDLGLKTSTTGMGTTAGAHVAVTAGMLDSFSIGGAKVEKMAVVIADFFAALNQAIGAPLDGIVGYNFLRNYKVVLDYPNERLALL